MTGLLVRWLVTFVAVMVTSFVLPQIAFPDITTLAIFSAVLALLNSLVRPVVLAFTCPLVLLSLGLFIFVINALMFLLAANLVPGAPPVGFLDAFLAALIVTLVSTVVSHLIR
jgi:putative membrane protein